MELVLRRNLSKEGFKKTEHKSMFNLILSRLLQATKTEIFNFKKHRSCEIFWNILSIEVNQ